MESQEVREVGFDPPAYAQRLTVTVEPASAGVKTYLVKQADEANVKEALSAEKEPAENLLIAWRGSDKAEAYSFEATIPAKTGYTVLLKTGAKPTEVKLTIVGK